MGVYVYTLRATCRTIKIDNVEVKAHLLKYAFKETYRYDGNTGRESGILARAATFWNGKQFPSCVVIGDKFEDGATVHCEYTNGWSACYDTPTFPGRFVGYLKRDGKQWTVVKNYDE